MKKAHQKVEYQTATMVNIGGSLQGQSQMDERKEGID